MSDLHQRLMYFQDRAYRDAINTLRANLQFTCEDSGYKVIAVTSVVPSEGKSSITANLAASLAEMNSTVIVIDCDYRRPMLGNILNIRSQKGLSDYILGLSQSSEVIHLLEDIKGMYFIDVGKEVPNMNWVYGSNRLTQFLKVLSNKFDYILLDTAPLGAFIEAAVIASRTDGTLLVSDLKKRTPKKRMLEVKNQLELANSKLIGVVFNNANDHNSDYGYGYYSKYYKYEDGK